MEKIDKELLVRYGGVFADAGCQGRYEAHHRPCLCVGGEHGYGQRDRAPLGERQPNQGINLLL